MTGTRHVWVPVGSTAPSDTKGAVMARITLHYCPRHSLMFGNYRRHMDEDHGGRSDCVVGLTSAQALRILDGESVSDVCFKRTASPA